MAIDTKTATNGELIRWSFGRLNARDVDALRQFWTDDTVEHFPDGTVRGADAIAAWFQRSFAAFPDAHVEIVALAEQGEDVLVHWRTSSVHRGPMLGVAPTGRTVSLEGMDHFVIRDGKLVSNTVVYDQMKFARDVGMLPADGTPADRFLKGAFNLRTKLLGRLGR